MSDVDDVRARADLLLRATSIAASFLGDIALADKQVGLAGVAAVLCDAV